MMDVVGSWRDKGLRKDKLLDHRQNDVLLLSIDMKVSEKDVKVTTGNKSEL